MPDVLAKRVEHLMAPEAGLKTRDYVIVAAGCWLRRIYSARSASTGSTAAARRAGSTPARSATASMSRAAPPCARGVEAR